MTETEMEGEENANCRRGNNEKKYILANNTNTSNEDELVTIVEETIKDDIRIKHTNTSNSDEMVTIVDETPKK